MGNTRQMSGLNILLLLLAMVLLFSGCAAQKESGQSLQNVDGSIVVKGKIRRINLEEHTLKVSPKKGDSVTVVLNDATAFEGVDSAQSLEKEQPVEVTYMVEGTSNHALHVKKLPEGSCD